MVFRPQGSELARLLDFLDRACTFLSAFRLATKQALQTIDTIPSNDDIYIQCFRQLHAVCGHHAAQPSSNYFASGEIIAGGISDVWEGTYCNKRDSIEYLKIPLTQASKKVRVRYGIPLTRVYSRTPVRAAVVYRTGCYMEKAKIPKYQPACGTRVSESVSSPTHFLGIKSTAHQSTSAFSTNLTGMFLAHLIEIRTRES